ncbi:cysteine-rich receptor-like protein kinase [Trifolium pratense]|uniref:Cysteine-rich receptor-like protein kinase n=1 Tax=Trifolium pratense TaxID=57577 RepID=A0A2K3MLH8_TRIPR|nr:cysteine-rich receptor-like protein kinase [Trifolium pratense]
MLSSLWHLFLFLPLFITLISGANDQLIPRYHECNQTLGNFSTGSDYRNNRDNVLKQIYSNIDYGFYNVSYGKNPNQVNAIAICRGDIEPEDCRGCLRTSAAVLITERCPLAYGAIQYYDLCTLRYSNDSIFGVMVTESGYVYNMENNKTEVDDAFSKTLGELLDGLKSTAAKGDLHKKFAENNTEVVSGSDSDDTIYGLVQCTPDLSKQDCTNCLTSAFRDLSSSCIDTKACMYLGPSCSVRYDISQFFTSIEPPTSAPAPQPLEALPPKTASNYSTNPHDPDKGTLLFIALLYVK